MNRQGIRCFVITFVALITGCHNPEPPTILDIDAPTGMQIFKLPQSGLKPPFILTRSAFEKRYVYADTSIDTSIAGTTLTGSIIQSMNQTYSGNLEASANSAALSLNLAVQLARQVKFTINAFGLRTYSIPPSDAKFKPGTDCVSFFTSFKDSSSNLVLQTLGADSIVLTASNIQSDSFRAALKASLGEKFKVGFEMAQQASGETNYTLTGKGLVFGYTVIPLRIELYSAAQPLNIEVPIHSQLDIPSVAGIEWIRAIGIDSTGDGSSFILKTYPKFGESIPSRLSMGEQKDIAVGNRLILTIALNKIEDNKAFLSVVGFNIIFKNTVPS